MSACASASALASSPWALSILYSDDEYPAASKAFFRYGRSNWVYRVDEVVSGRMTPTDPLPAACRSFSWAIAEKLWSNDLTPSPAGTVALAEVPAVELPPHAATTTASAPAHAIMVN